MDYVLGFYIVLFALIGFITFFVSFMYIMSKKFSPLMMKVMSTLHAAIFGYESALIDLIGPRGYKTHVFPKIVEIIEKLKSEDPIIEDLFDAKDAKTAMDKWMNVLKKVNVTKEGEVVEIEKDVYEIKVPDCSMAHPIHDMIGGQKGICPMGLIVAAASSIADEGKIPEIDYSKFYPEGTSTKLRMVKE